MVSAAAIQRAADTGLDEPTAALRLADGGSLFVMGIDRLPAAAQLELVASLDAMAQGRDGAPNTRLLASTTVRSDSALGAALDARLLESLQTRIELPQLRDRLDDVLFLAEYFLRAHATRLGRQVERLPDGAEARLRAYPWPGNVQELDQVIERAVLTADGPVAALESALVSAGQTVGAYRLRDQIGAGGMGEVWRASHDHLSRPAAVKLIKTGKIWSSDAREQAERRFRREAGATSALRSPHTVELYDFGILDNGDLYYVMEYLDGLDLRTLVERHGPMEPERVVMVLEQVCHSLMEAHEAGLVHRDIKPANLLLCRYGPDADFLKVLDFGIVSVTNQDDTLTQPGTVAGTPSTIAPETLNGETEPRSDLYALGCTAYYMLTGRNVFTSSVPQIYFDHAATPPIAPSVASGRDMPRELDDLVLALLAKAPQDRPRSARVLRSQLRELALGSPWTQERAAAWWAERGQGPSEDASEPTQLERTPSTQ
jgi:serine/threonine protein kinase